MSKIIFIRHGITEGNKKRWFYGASDIHLAEEGTEQLKKQRDEGMYPKIPEGSQVFTSGLIRTEETLFAIYGELPHEALTDLQEMNFGEYECHNFSELKDDPVFMEWGYDQVGDIALPGGESRNDFAKRVRRGADTLLEKHIAYASDFGLDAGIEPVTLMVSHGGVISGIMHEWFPGQKVDMWHWMTRPGSGYEVEIRNGKPIGATLIGEAEYSEVTDELEEAIK